MIKESFGRKAFLCTNNIILFLLAVCTPYPLLYVLFASLSNPYEYMRHTGLLLRPLKTTLSSYKLVFNNDQILTGYINTLVVVGVGTAINMFFTVLGAYFFSRRRVHCKNPCFWLFCLQCI